MRQARTTALKIQGSRSLLFSNLIKFMSSGWTISILGNDEVHCCFYSNTNFNKFFHIFFCRIKCQICSVTFNVLSPKNWPLHQRIMDQLIKGDTNGHTKKSQTPKESSKSSRKLMNMSDVYSADSPKPEKRKQASTIPIDDPDALPKTKSETRI
jgi:hypothetical protein